jgi:non-homologous end joining protein Ku
MVNDPLRDWVPEIIASKGVEPGRLKAAAERPHDVVSIMDALHKSIAEKKERPRSRQRCKGASIGPPGGTRVRRLNQLVKRAK